MHEHASFPLAGSEKTRVTPCLVEHTEPIVSVVFNVITGFQIDAVQIGIASGQGLCNVGIDTVLSVFREFICIPVHVRPPIMI